MSSVDRLVAPGQTMRQMFSHTRSHMSGHFGMTPQCDYCAHLHSDGCTCDAFPERIPDGIFVNVFDHRRPFPGDEKFPSDNGVLFAPKPGMEHPDDCYE